MGSARSFASHGAVERGSALIVFLSILAGVASAAAPDAVVGRAAPTLYLRQLDGREFYLSRVTGQGAVARRVTPSVVVLGFFATWCVPCREELPLLDSLSRRYEGKQVIWRLVDIGDEPDSVRAFLGRLGVRMPALLDQYKWIAPKYCGDPPGVPKIAVVDRAGVLRYLSHGFAGHATIAEVAATIDEALGPSPMDISDR